MSKEPKPHDELTKISICLFRVESNLSVEFSKVLKYMLNDIECIPLKNDSLPILERGEMLSFDKP